MVDFCGRVAGTAWFRHTVTALILFAGILVGAETYPSIVKRFGAEINILNEVILWIFVLEIIIKLIAQVPHPLRYFKDGWNIFDFVIVGSAFLPGIGQFAVTLRLLRLLRVLKLLSALPRLQLLVSALLKSIPSMFSVTLLLFILFYVYAVAAVFLFGANDPIHFRSLEMSLLSLFRVVTLEDWTDIMYIQMYGSDAYGYSAADLVRYAAVLKPQAQPLVGALFFVSFVLMGTMIVLNLFIGVIMTGMDQAHEEQQAMLRKAAAKDSDGELGPEPELDHLKAQIKALQARQQALEDQASQRP